ncbi:MAG: Swt1 family HEPN domain-containing protein [Hormoscilla sp.]
MTNSNATPTAPNSLKQNKRLVDTALEDILVPGLTPFIKREMKRVYKKDWLQKAREKLQHYHRDGNDLNWEDPQVILQLLLNHWRDAFLQPPEFDHQEKSLVSNLLAIRGQVKHNAFKKYDNEYTDYVLYNMELLLKAVPNDKTAREKAQEVRKLREDFSLPDESTFAKQLAVNIQPDDNPFIPLTGRVETPQLFFGREKEIQRVFETLNSGSSVALIGDRSIGKSSLLWAICQQAESKMTSPRKPIYINLQYILDDNDFYEALCYEVGIDVCKGYSLNRALKQQRPRLLLVLDEVEKMTWDGFTNQLRAQLRGLAEGGDAPLRLVVAASTSLDKLFPDSQAMGMTSPFTNICIEERINAWDEARVREFISHRLATTQILFEEDDISQIVRKSGGHPKRVMDLCHTIYEGYKEKTP